jgi:thiamine-phosphate pyrophosphorylase
MPIFSTAKSMSLARLSKGEQMSQLRRLRQQAFSVVDLYPVTSAEHSRGRGTLAIVEAVMAAGCHIVQLREKGLSKAEYFSLAQKVRQMTSGRLMICNDHLDVALAVGADGVHLGTEDLPVEAARHLAPDLLLGASTHTLEEARSAQRAGADYVNIGPIFATATKENAAAFLGLAAIGHITPLLGIPFTVMGGIHPHNIGEVLAAGARRIAVVSAITAAEDPLAAAVALRQQILSTSAVPPLPVNGRDAEEPQDSSGA